MDSEAFDKPGSVRPKKTFILCFDGTGNKFSGDETDSNILKIYRMIDRGDGNTYTFYQPGIGTYVSDHHFQSPGPVSRMKSWYIKSKDAAVGSSFADHVMGGYKFLMRYYSCEDDLYFFGFSRGAYTARFLAEMLDHVGLLSAGNEELTRFAWKTYAKWANRGPTNTPQGKKAEDDLHRYMQGFRETFSRVVRRIRFLGLFDTVNSVPAFEVKWMQRSRFPYTARSSAKVIRHAVSIDERRAKFRQDLITSRRRHQETPEEREAKSKENPPAALVAPSINVVDTSGTQQDGHLGVNLNNARGQPRPSLSREGSFADSTVARSDGRPASLRHRIRRRWSDVAKTQDIQEVWFAGGHGDIGGGWKSDNPDKLLLAHVPLAWMVEEAQKAGLKFDPIKLHTLHCCPDKLNEFGEREPCPIALDTYNTRLMRAGRSTIHDCLDFNGGLDWTGTLGWKVMEYLPFKRMDLQPDGSWNAIWWPLPLGETRDVPKDAQIHVSVVRRLENDEKYRPGNLIIGGGGRGVRHAAEKDGIGDWVVHSNDGHDTCKTYVRREE